MHPEKKRPQSQNLASRGIGKRMRTAAKVAGSALRVESGEKDPGLWMEKGNVGAFAARVEWFGSAAAHVSAPKKLFH